MKTEADVGLGGACPTQANDPFSASSARLPKIAAYPLYSRAELGVAEINHRQIVVTDIPHLLEGAQ